MDGIPRRNYSPTSDIDASSKVKNGAARRGLPVKSSEVCMSSYCDAWCYSFNNVDLTSDTILWCFNVWKSWIMNKFRVAYNGGLPRDGYR